MNHEDLLHELDRDMNAAYDEIYILNTLVSTLLPLLPAPTLSQLVPALDQQIDNLIANGNPLSDLAKQRVFGLRNLAAQHVAMPVRAP